MGVQEKKPQSVQGGKATTSKRGNVQKSEVFRLGGKRRPNLHVQIAGGTTKGGRREREERAERARLVPERPGGKGGEEKPKFSVAGRQS